MAKRRRFLPMRVPTRFNAYQQRIEKLSAIPVVGFGVRWLHRTLDSEVFDRSMGLAAQFLASLIPLLIVIAVLAPVRTDSYFWTALGRWLGLRGASQQTIQELVGRGGKLTVDTSWISLVILIISAFSFIRALQRAFERIWQLEPLSFKNAPRQMAWLITLLGCLWIGYLMRSLSISLRGAPATPLLAAAYLLIDLAFWWLTPFLLLGGRISLRQLLPGSVVSWAALAVFFRISTLYMPGRINASATQYGPIGLIFVILSWYFILFCIAVGGSSLGPVLVNEDNAIARYMRGEHVTPH
jgi:membrane protein